jgi:uncharacterized protein YjbI with pentapeptide repeats
MSTGHKLFTIKSWASKAGQKILLQLARGTVSPQPTFDQLGLPSRERTFLLHILRVRKGFAAKDISEQKRVWLARSVALELDFFRGQFNEALQPLTKQQRSFTGNKTHLELLERSLNAPLEINEWNEWRRKSPQAIPDLRGIRLARYDLRSLNLNRAKLNRANLFDCRFGKLRHADLSDANLDGVNLNYADLSYAKLTKADLQNVQLTDGILKGTRLRGARLIGCILNRANLERADLRDTLIWGTSLWQVVRDSKTKQSNISIGWNLLDPLDVAAFGISKEDEETSTRINDVMVADFMSLVANNRKNIASIVDAASNKLVLLLGRFQGIQANVLKMLEEKLPSYGYIPMIFDFEGPKNRDVIETVAILAGLSKFVIADLTNPRSTPLESHLIIPEIAVPFIPIIRGTRPFSMFDALKNKYRWVLPPLHYKDEADLEKQIKKHIVEPAESLAKTLRKMKHPKPQGS